MPDYHTNALNDSLRSLSDSLLLRTAVKHLADNSAAINTELMDMVLAKAKECPILSAGGTVEVAEAMDM